ncbi:unnamed protein product [Zymoseptoria tritici ST99CH_3D1]|nr:unnamed protein product [Zymoseptoria tritici ST99CH_3D1]
MSSRNFAEVPPTAATMALNAYIYGYGGHSLVTPHQALKRQWWTDERIDNRVTRAFVISKLRGEEREFLDRALAFGEGLTDDTYMEWILERAKRLFLILTQIGVPDQIFGCIDDSWDDDDLPIPFDNVKSLELSCDNDEALNKRFYDMQFIYLLRELKKGSHIDYGPKEHIPMEHVNTLPPAATLQPYDRVHFPGRPEEVFMRRKYSMTDKDNGHFTGDTFTKDVRRARALAHEHVASTWATYTSENAAYLLSDFVPEHTLATFIEHRTPASYVKVRATERPLLICEWMHCLSDALASLHHRGVAHTAIRPSNIWIDSHNHIALADVGAIPTYQRNKKVPKNEIYDYAAPESQLSKSAVVVKTSASPSSPPISSMNAFSKLRKLSTSDHGSISGASSSASSSTGGSSTRSNSFVNLAGTSPITPPSTSARSSSFSAASTALSPTPSAARSPRGIRNFSRRLVNPTKSFASSAASSEFLSITSPLIEQQSPSSGSMNPATLRDLPTATPEMSDIYSLGCVYLDLLTFLVRGKTTDFAKFRTTRISHQRQQEFKAANVTSSSKTGTTMAPPPSKTDSSFHTHPDQLSTWLNMLSTEASASSNTSSSTSGIGPNLVLARGIPRLLNLVRSMIAQNATLRPTAIGVREVIEEVLEECGVRGDRLCCWGRGWEVSEEVEADIGRARGSGDRSGSFAAQDMGAKDAKAKKEKKSAAPKVKKEKKEKKGKFSRPSSALSNTSASAHDMDMSILQRLDTAYSPPATPATTTTTFSPPATPTSRMMSPPPLFSPQLCLKTSTTQAPSETELPPPPPGPPPTSLPPPPPTPTRLTSTPLSPGSLHPAPREVKGTPPRSFSPALSAQNRKASTDPRLDSVRPSTATSHHKPTPSTPQIPPLAQIPPLSAFPAMSIPPLSNPPCLSARPSTSAADSPQAVTAPSPFSLAQFRPTTSAANKTTSVRKDSIASQRDVKYFAPPPVSFGAMGLGENVSGSVSGSGSGSGTNSTRESFQQTRRESTTSTLMASKKDRSGIAKWKRLFS